MAYQGFLAIDGHPAEDPSATLTFRVFDSESGGTELWLETQSGLSISGGVFSVILGASVSLSPVSFEGPRWLSVAVGDASAPQLDPRTPFTAVPYSMATRGIRVTPTGPGNWIRIDGEAGVSVGTDSNLADLTVDGTAVILGDEAEGGQLTLMDGDREGGWEIDNAGSSGFEDLRVFRDRGFDDAFSVMTVKTDGRVGLGVTDPATELEVAGDISVHLGNRLVLGVPSTLGHGEWIQNTKSDTEPFGIGFYGFYEERMRITNDGQVAINTIAPNAESQLHVATGMQRAGYFTSDLPSSETHAVHAEVTAEEAADATAVYGKADVNPFWGIGGTFSGGWKGVTGFAQVPGSGERVGIQGFGWYSEDTNYGVIGNAFSFDASSTNYGIYGSASGGAGTTNYAVFADGDLAYTGSLISVSDRKLKQNLIPQGETLSKLLRLEVTSFEHRRDGDAAKMNLARGRHVGFVAQQVEEVFPDLVVEGVHVQPRTLQDKSDTSVAVRFKGLRQSELIPLLVKAIQEQQAQIDELRQRLAAVEGN
jgi:hypothetical protein